MNKHSETILVVEDDAQIRNFITYILKQEGFPCLTSGTAQNALSQLVSRKIDLVLLDLGLPDFDGMEVIKKVPISFLKKAYHGLHDLDLELAVQKVGLE